MKTSEEFVESNFNFFGAVIKFLFATITCISSMHAINSELKKEVIIMYVKRKYLIPTKIIKNM